MAHALTPDDIAANAWRAFPHTYATRQTMDLAPELRWRAHEHLRLISLAIVRLIDQGGGVLLVSMPPRHGKSELISRWTPEWFLALYPHKRVMLLSYAAELAEEWSRRARDGFVQHGGRIASDKAAIAWWATAEGGSMSAAGIGGSIMGKGADLIIIDDAVKNAEEAASETVRSKQKSSFNSDIWTRRQPGCVVIVLMTRWHTDDLYAHVKATVPAFEELTLPAICDTLPDALGRSIGDPLCPGLIPLDMLNDAKTVLSPAEWNALFMQRPTDLEGAEIKRAWWRWYDELPVGPELMDLRILSVDATFRDSDGSDYVAIGAAGVYGVRRYMLDMVRERMGFVDTVKAILTMREKHRPHVIVIEAKANGDAIIEQLQREGCAELVGITPKASKLARARASSPQIEAGNVWLPRGARWAEHMVEEHAAFPLGKHDDTVDMMSQLLNYLADMRALPTHELRGGDDRFVPPHIAEERQNDSWRSVFDRVRRAV